MSLIEIAGFLGAAIIGLSLGLIGGGGSILTVPVLVYLLAVEPVLATAYSLFVVGSSALIGAANYARKGLVSFKTAAVFAVPALIAVYLTRLYLVPALPQVWFKIGSLTVTKDIGILVLFALLMIFASYSMIRGKGKSGNGESEEDTEPVFQFPNDFRRRTSRWNSHGTRGSGRGIPHHSCSGTFCAITHEDGSWDFTVDYCS